LFRLKRARKNAWRAAWKRSKFPPRMPKIWYNSDMADSKKKRKKPKVMRFRQSLFWDVDPKTIKPKRHAVYIIERILDFGNDNEVRWMWYYYSHPLIAKVVKESRVLHARTRPLWTLLLAKP